MFKLFHNNHGQQYLEYFVIFVGVMVTVLVFIGPGTGPFRKAVHGTLDRTLNEVITEGQLINGSLGY